MKAHRRASNRFRLPAPFGVFGVAILVAACTAPSASQSNQPVAAGSRPPSAASSTPPSSVRPTSRPPSASVTPAPPTPSPTPADWSDPVTVEGLGGCGNVVAAVDELGGTHLAASCGVEATEIRYASLRGGAWETVGIKPAPGRLDVNPQLAFSGNTLYLGWSRLSPEDGGCGDPGLADIGAFVQTRALPNGEWSSPVRIGAPADHLLSLRVTGATIHATVSDGDTAEVAYLAVSAGATTRVPLPKARGSAALRIGGDGLPRVVYTDDDGLVFGTIRGERVRVERVPDTGRAHSPVLALAPGNDAYLLWTESYAGGGCAEPDPPPTDGTYFGTNEGGSWLRSRLTKMIGSASLTIDPSSGDLHAVVSDYRKLAWFHRGVDGRWQQETVVAKPVTNAVIRQDPTSGRLVVAYVEEIGDQEFHVKVITR